MEDSSVDFLADPSEISDSFHEDINREEANSCILHTGIQVVPGDRCYTLEGMCKKGLFANKQDASPEGRRNFECDICSRSFSDPSNLRRHKNIHTDQRPYSCEICRKTFRQKSQLDRHQFVHTGERPFQCAFCPKGFRDSTELKVHYRKHTGERPYKCELCPRGFSRVSYLKKHEETHRELERAAALEEIKVKDTTSNIGANVSIPGKFKCSFCNLSFLKKSLLEAHRTKHYKISPTGQKLYECSECKKCFNNSSNLHKHTIIHKGIKPFACTICAQHFRQATHLERHYMVHTGERPFKCSICQKGFRDTSDLQKHQRVHTGEKPYHCPICMKSFKHLHNARVHRQRHLAGGITVLRLSCLPRTVQANLPSSSIPVKLDTAVTCLMCNLELRTQRQVQNHHCKLIRKSRQKVRRCIFCSKIFAGLAGLRCHYRTNPSHKPFTCPICKKTFRQLLRLERHQKTHTELESQRPMFQKTFSEPKNQMKILKCELCDKTFSRMFLLSNHLLSHEEEPSTETVKVEDLIIKVEDVLS